eukprot:3212362-Alexandrium_andersonii.AAC.1
MATAPPSKDLSGGVELVGELCSGASGQTSLAVPAPLTNQAFGARTARPPGAATMRAGSDGAR